MIDFLYSHRYNIFGVFMSTNVLFPRIMKSEWDENKNQLN